MATHPRDHASSNPRLQCSCCAQWKRLHPAEGKPVPMSPGGYPQEQRFYGGCAYTLGDHPAGEDVCDDCCHIHCRAKATPEQIAAHDRLRATFIAAGAVPTNQEPTP